MSNSHSLNRERQGRPSAQMIREAGFGRVQWRNLSMGIAALHSGWKL